MSFKVAVLPGDGIGPEVIAEAVKVLKACGVDYEFSYAPFGGAAYDVAGDPLPESTLELCQNSDAILMGAVGGPKWDRIEPISKRPEVGGLLKLRGALNLYANLRPAKTLNALLHASPLREGKGKMDLMVVRELTGGIYFGQPRERKDNGNVALDTCVYSRMEVERIAIRGFETAMQRRKQLVSVDKANVLETSRLWREVVDEIAARYPDVNYSHMLVDNCAMQLVRDPGQFDVILTENLFGDILSDEASMITGSLGLLPSASLSDPKEGTVFGMYEPIHGSAPDIAGQNRANPLATILSAAMMVRYSFEDSVTADRIEAAVESALDAGLRTADIFEHGSQLVGTAEMGDAVAARV
ncbi:3-isopropylmalate dehydrogenase [Kamptonema cortianum]|nr:3-isopropylmalate dehydrogenase [Geitlerinema splendidum]MDK3156098.1 3-isopropylmalate dehydrogenase [Kamptonema cortianum]